jgi:hypothetical protein
MRQRPIKHNDATACHVEVPASPNNAVAAADGGADAALKEALRHTTSSAVSRRVTPEERAAAVADSARTLKRVTAAIVVAAVVVWGVMLARYAMAAASVVDCTWDRDAPKPPQGACAAARAARGSWW